MQMRPSLIDVYGTAFPTDLWHSDCIERGRHTAVAYDKQLCSLSLHNSETPNDGPSILTRIVSVTAHGSLQCALPATSAKPTSDE